MKKTMCMFAGFLLAAGAGAETILIGGDTLNGNFNTGTGGADKWSYAELASWVNLGKGGADWVVSRTNVAYRDGGRNVILAERAESTVGIDTGYAMKAGDVFSISYVWQDGFKWADAADKVNIRLFVTDDNTITGKATTLVNSLSKLSAKDSTYQAEDQAAIYTALAADAGKTLFVALDTQNGDKSAVGFARIDNFVLTVTP